MTSYLTPQQIGYMLEPIDPTRVANLRGMSHLEAHDIRVNLTRIFGFGRWSADVISMDLIYEQATTTKQGKDALDVGYKAGLRLTVNAPDGTELATYTEYAVGAHTQPAYMRGDLHDFAMKTAESQALKRCATNLGDQFGLSLYNNGYLGAIVQGTLNWGVKEAPKELEVAAVPVEGEQQPEPLEQETQQPAQQQAPQQQQQQQQAPAPTQQQPAPQAAAQQPAQEVQLTAAQAEVRGMVADLEDADRATFRAAWKKAQLPAGYHRLNADHIQWVHAQIDTLLSTGVDNPVDGPDLEAQYQEQLQQEQGAPRELTQERQALVEQARAQFPNAPAGADPFYN